MRRYSIGRAGLLSISAAGMLLGAGCATQDEQSYNENFNQDLPVNPKYVIEDQGMDRFKIRLYQGSPLPGPERVTYMKEAATVVARDEARRRGWGDWRLDYIDERDQGWMHILVAEVKNQPPVASPSEMTPAAPPEPLPATPPAPPSTTEPGP